MSATENFCPQSFIDDDNEKKRKETIWKIYWRNRAYTFTCQNKKSM